MVSICAGCDGYYPWAAALVASVAGILYVIVSKTMASVKIDDPLDAVAVHASSGLWGIMAAPIFMQNGRVAICLPSDIVITRYCIHCIRGVNQDVDVECYWSW